MSIINRGFLLDGVLTDMTSVLLSDPTGTYGVRRTDTGATVVVDGTAMTHVSTGVYEWTFTDPALDIEYEYYLEVTSGGETYWIADSFAGPTSAAAGPADSTLAVTYEDLVREVAFFFGFGWKTSSELQAQDLALVDSKVQAGYHQFLFPPVLPRETVGHVWSFLSPAATLNLVATDYDYNLPNDFGGMLGDFNYAPDAGRAPVPLVGEGQVMAARARANITGYPAMAAIRPKAPTGTAEQHYEVLVYPTPAGSYTWYYRYNVLAGKLTTAAPRALGAMQHRQTLIESCLAMAEEGNDEQGVHLAAFLRNLEASISYDRQTSSPKTLGYNSDRSVVPTVDLPVTYVTYNHVLYGP